MHRKLRLRRVGRPILVGACYNCQIKRNSSVCLIKRNLYLFRGCVYFYNRQNQFFFHFFFVFDLKFTIYGYILYQRRVIFITFPLSERKNPGSIKVYSFFPLMLSGILIPPLGIAVSPFSAVPFFCNYPEKWLNFSKNRIKYVRNHLFDCLIEYM